MSLAALLILALDQLTKLWISTGMELGQSNSVIEGYVRFRYTHNTGAAFGIFADSTGILSIISLLVIVGILIAFVRLGHPSWVSVLAAGLVTGGALGNLADRIRLGYVVDFVEVYTPQVRLNNMVYTFPVFNVADSAITVGVILILLNMLFGKSSEAPPTRADATPSPADTEAEANNASLVGR